MRLDRFLEDMGYQFQELFWRDVPDRGRRGQIESLRQRIDENILALKQQRLGADHLRNKIASKEKQAAWLAERVEIYLHVGDDLNAWRHALDLDHLRHSIEEETRRLREQRNICNGCQASLQQLQRQFDELRTQLAFGR